MVEIILLHEQLDQLLIHPMLADVVGSYKATSIGEFEQGFGFGRVHEHTRELKELMQTVPM